MTFFFEDLQKSYLQLRCIDGVLWSAKCFTGRVTDFPYLENKATKVQKNYVSKPYEQ